MNFARRQMVTARKNGLRRPMGGGWWMAQVGWSAVGTRGEEGGRDATPTHAAWNFRRTVTDVRRHSSEFSIGSREHYSVKPITKRALDYEIDSTRPTDRIYIHARTLSLSPLLVIYPPTNFSNGNNGTSRIRIPIHRRVSPSLSHLSFFQPWSEIKESSRRACEIGSRDQLDSAKQKVSPIRKSQIELSSQLARHSRSRIVVRIKGKDLDKPSQVSCGTYPRPSHHRASLQVVRVTPCSFFFPVRCCPNSLPFSRIVVFVSLCLCLFLPSFLPSSLLSSLPSFLSVRRARNNVRHRSIESFERYPSIGFDVLSSNYRNPCRLELIPIPHTDRKDFEPCRDVIA